MLSRAARCSNNAWLWNTNPTRRRNGTSRVSGGTGPGASANPSMRIAPASNGWSAATARSAVVLPTPDGPISATISPRATSKDNERRMSRESWRTHSPSITSRAVVMPPASGAPAGAPAPTAAGGRGLELDPLDCSDGAAVELRLVAGIVETGRGKGGEESRQAYEARQSVVDDEQL